MNSVNLCGNLTRDPEMRFTPNNTAVTTFCVAINEGKDRVTFVDVECWQNTAEMVNQYWRKGKAIALTGRLTLDQWTDKDGGNRSKLKVTAERVYFVGPKESGGETRQPSQQPQHAVVDEDDIPF